MPTSRALLVMSIVIFISSTFGNFSSGRASQQLLGNTTDGLGDGGPDSPPHPTGGAQVGTYQDRDRSLWRV